MRSRAAEQFARLIIELQPYRDEIVFVGGWVHTLYLAEENESGGVATEDIDITLPSELRAGDRPLLVELAARAGFERDPISDMGGVAPWMVYTNDAGHTVPIDFLTEGHPRAELEIAGQDGLVAQGYTGQRMLLENARSMRVGISLHPLIDPPCVIRVPTLGAYVLQKGVSANTRLHPDKRAKDIIYILEIVSHPRLGPGAFAELPQVARRYPKEAAIFREAIEETLKRESLLDDVVEQMSLSSDIHVAPESLKATHRGWLRRLLAEA